MKGAHNQPVETVAGTARRDQILFQADFVLLIKETLEEPFQKTQVFRIDARNQGKMMDQQADPLQKCQGLFLEQYPRTALQELIRKKIFWLPLESVPLQRMGLEPCCVMSSSPFTQVDDFCRDTEGVQVICPPLQHAAALVEVFRTVLDLTDLVRIDVGKLSFDRVGMPASALVEDRAGGAAETVGGRPGMIAHAVECIEQGVFTHRAIRILLSRENQDFFR